MSKLEHMKGVVQGQFMSVNALQNPVEIAGQRISADMTNKAQQALEHPPMELEFR